MKRLITIPLKIIAVIVIGVIAFILGVRSTGKDA